MRIEMRWLELPSCEQPPQYAIPVDTNIGYVFRVLQYRDVWIGQDEVQGVITGEWQDVPLE